MGRDKSVNSQARGRGNPASLVVSDCQDESSNPDLNKSQFKPARIISVELPYILPEDQSRYLELAAQNPNMLCSEAPPEILQASSFAGDEPTAFLFEFFATGYNQWHLRTHGFSIDFDQERVARGVLLLWFRACDLYTSLEYERPHSDWSKEFFSDVGL